MRRIACVVAVITLGLVTGGGTAESQTIQLPKTGQTTCWDTNGVEIPCAGTGQDGDIQAGVSCPDPRFTDHGDGTVTDECTGLMWTKDADPTDTWVTWQEALNYIRDMNASLAPNFGYTDWRLPNPEELKSFSFYGSAYSSLPPEHPFSDIEDIYWTSTTYPRFSQTNDALAFWTFSTHLTALDKSSAVAFSVWPVRSGANGNPNPAYPANVPKTGQARCWDATGIEISCEGTGQDGELQWGVKWPDPRFEDHGDGTITDHLTGVMWTKDAALAGEVSWQTGLGYVRDMNNGIHENFGYSDWRTPNIVEITTMFSYTDYPAPPDPNPFQNVLSGGGGWHWSSTTFLPPPANEAMTVGWNNMGSGQKSKTAVDYMRVWPVRGGSISSQTPQLSWPLEGDRSKWETSDLFGSVRGTGIGQCFGIELLHSGWDLDHILDSPGGKSVYAAHSGNLKAVFPIPGPSNPRVGECGYGVTIENAGDGMVTVTTSQHLDTYLTENDTVAGIRITRGQKIGTVKPIADPGVPGYCESNDGDPSHLHLGTWTDTFYTNNDPNRGVLPKTACGNLPAYPANFINPEPLVYTDQVFTLAGYGMCPDLVTLLMSFATPSDRVVVFYGDTTGSTIIDSGPCAGTELGIALAQAASGFIFTDEKGEGQAGASLLPEFCTKLMQGVDVATCTTSNVYDMTFLPVQ